jgi:dCTP deaminase
MLSKTTITGLLRDNKFMDFETDSDRESFIDKSIQSSSVDLSIELIFKPGCLDKQKNGDDFSLFGTENYILKSGQTIVIQIKEKFNLPTNISGMIFPPNSLAKKGLIMTNPGHIDPGYKGKITVCLVNMGKEPVPLYKGQSIATLLTFFTDVDTNGYQHTPGTGVSKTQIDNLSEYFANLDWQILKYLTKISMKYILILITLLSFIFGIFAIGVPELAKRLDSSNKIQTLNDKYVAPLEITMDLKIKKLNESIMIPIEANLDSKIKSLKDSQIIPLESRMEAKINKLEARIKELESISHPP